MDSKQQAQSRVEQIKAFNLELALLEKEHVLNLPKESKSQLTAYHDDLVIQLANTFDIDANPSDKQLTIGMRVASFLGALAFAASIFFLFYQYWGHFSVPVQTMVLITAPVISLGLTWLFFEKESSGYFAKILELVTVVCFVLNLSMLGQIYNITPSPNAFIIWSALALGLAYKTNSRLLLTLAILFFAGFLSARVGTWFGIYWLSLGARPESFFVPAAILYWFGHRRQLHFESFAVIYRVLGALLVLLPILTLAHWSGGSYFKFSNGTIEIIYQLVGFLMSAGLIWYGVKQGWKESINTGCIFFTLFLYSKFFDWWWDWMPKYVFFLVVALSSVLLLLVFKRLRIGYKSVTKGVAHV